MLIVVASIIALVAALNVWVKRQVLDTNNWTTTSSSLLENDEIRGALSVYLVNQLYTNVDVQARIQQRLPEQLKGLAAPLAAASRGAATNGVDELLSRPRVQQAWKTEKLKTTNGKVVLDLSPLVEQLANRQGLIGTAAQKLPPDAGKLVIMDSKQLDTAQKAVKVIRVLSYFLTILALALYALAVYLARGARRTTLMGIGFAVLTVGIILLGVRRFAGDYVVDSLTKNPDFKAATRAAYEIGTHLLRNTALNLVFYGAAIVVAAWLAGPSRPATAIRRWLAPTFRDRPVVAYAVFTLGLFIVVITGPTDASRLVPLLILFGFAYLGLHVLRRQTLREFPTPGKS